MHRSKILSSAERRVRGVAVAQHRRQRLLERGWRAVYPGPIFSPERFRPLRRRSLPAVLGDNNGSLHHLDTRKLRLVRDPDRTFLDVPQSGDPILHLKEDEPITVEGQDHQGAFSSPWFPFLLGATLGNAFGGGRGGGQTIIINNPAPGERSYDANTPTYRYPPTGSFGRDDSLHGSIDTSKPQPPDYSRVQPAPYATLGQSRRQPAAVTAATNKAPGGASGASNATSGQAGGTGAGTAASNKGGFAGGSQSYANRQSGDSSSVGAGSRGVLGGTSSNGGTSNRPSTGVSGGSSKGIGGARAPSGGRR